MNEARKFLRYVMPGLILLIEVGLYLSISNWMATVKILEEVGGNIVLLIGTFLVSGGIGYFLGSIYHTLSGRTTLFDRIGIDHKTIITDAIARGWLTLHWRDSTRTDKPTQNMINRDGAWNILTSVWWERKTSSEKMKGSSESLDRFYDILHGLGATLIGSVIAAFIWLSLYLHFYWIDKTIPPSHINLWLLIPTVSIIFVVIIFHVVNYNRTARKTQSVVEIIFSSQLHDESRCKSISVYISENDLNLN